MKNTICKILFLLALFIVLPFLSCSKSNTENPNAIITDTFAKGADVGWLSQMEATGYKFYDADGTEKKLLATVERPWNKHNSFACFCESFQ